MSENLLIGSTLGQYQIEALIGRGAVSAVYRAYQANAKRRVAIKVYPRAFLDDDGTFVERFQQEARLIARLEHFNILPIYDVGHDRGRPFLAMRYVRGGSLADLIVREGRITPAKAQPIMQQVAGALDYAHARSAVHRNLSANNILFDEDGNAFITDFSLSCVREAVARITGSGVIGKPSYVAPEIASGERMVRPATDIYALGVLLYQMLTGELPYNADAPIKLIMMHVTEPIPTPSVVNPSLTPDVDAVVMKAMAKKPEDRYASAGELARALIAATPARGTGRSGDEGTRVLGPADKPAVITDGLSKPRPAADLPPAPPPEEQGSRRRQARAERQRRREARRQERELRRAAGRGLPWYTVALVLILLVVAWAAVGILLGNQFRQQAINATLAAVDTQEAQTRDAVAAAAGTADALAAAAAVPTGTATTAPAETAAPTVTTVLTSTPLPTRTPAPTATPQPTPTALAGGGGLIALASNQDGDNEIFVLDTASGSLTQVTANTTDDRQPAWSPDGALIAFSGSTGMGRHIFVTDPAGTDVQELTAGIRTDTLPLWMPDGERISFFYDDGQRSYISSVTTDGEEQLIIQLPRSELVPFAWSPDAAALTYLGLGPDSFLELMRVEVASGQRSPLSALRGALEWVDYSPDGQYAVYSVLLLATQRRQLYLAETSCTPPISFDTCDLVRLTDDFFNYTKPRFSPDSTRILVTSDRGGSRDLWLLDLQGEVVRQLTDLPSDEFDGVWQPRP
ncbi:MAG: hypothetical protein Kow00124_14340 [Anaerolineae bacterium]